MDYKYRFKQNPIITQWLILIAALLVLGGVIGLHIFREYEHTRDDEQERLLSVVRMLKENISQDLIATKGVLIGLRPYRPKPDMDKRLNERLGALCDAMPGVRTLLILDAEGTIRASNRAELIGKNFSHRDYFQVPKNIGDAEMFYVSPPFVTTLGVYTLNISVTIPGPRGEFTGVISAALEPAYFKPLMESVVYAPDMWTAIAHGDGALFLIIPEQGDLVGKKFPPDSPFYLHKESGREEFVHRARYQNGQERLIVGQTITTGLKKDKPLFIAASRDYKAVLAGWRQYALIQGGLYVTIVLVSMLSLYVFQLRQRSFNRQKTEMENKLKEAEENYRELAENAADGILIASGEDQIVYANRRAAEITGYTVSQLLETGIRSLLDRDILTAAGKNRKNDGGAITPEPQETVIICKNGNNVPVEITVTQTRWERKRADMIFIRDITARKIAEEKLIAATKELERSNKELDDFAYIASHDLKEPLRGINNYATFLLEDYADKLDDAGREKLKTLTYLTKRMDGLIEDLLQFSRVNKLKYHPAEVNLKVLVEDVLSLLKLQIEKEGVEIHLSETLPTVQADENQIIKIFQNLIVNAIKYNDKANKRVEIGSIAAEKKPAIIYVRDNGIGIDEKYYDVIFRIFKRLHGRDKFGGGTGAGLTIVKKIVERHGGKIWVESVLGEGTTFYFTLEGDKDGR